jgi:hypothetical protein
MVRVDGLDVRQQMIRIIAILFVATLQMFAQTLGRASFFEHVGDRSKSIEQGTYHILITGRETGLMLQCPKKVRISFPKNKSTVLTPNGQQINLTFKNYGVGDKLQGYWVAEFAVKHVMMKGLYQYDVVISIDGKEHAFRHELIYSFDKIEPDKGTTTQL